MSSTHSWRINKAEFEEGRVLAAEAGVERWGRVEVASMDHTHRALGWEEASHNLNAGSGSQCNNFNRSHGSPYPHCDPQNYQLQVELTLKIPAAPTRMVRGLWLHCGYGGTLGTGCSQGQEKQRELF